MECRNFALSSGIQFKTKKVNLKKIVNNLHNDCWQRELFQIHTTNEATLQEVEASALVLEQAHNQQQKIQAFGKNDAGTESGI